MGLALSLAHIPPRLPRFRPLSHRLRRRLVWVASVSEAAARGSASEVNKGLVASQQPPAIVGVVCIADIQKALVIIDVFGENSL